jgi:predicted DNA-binding protein
MSTTSFRLDEDLQEKLDVIAARLQRSKGWIINDALRQYIEREERKQRRVSFTRGEGRGDPTDESRRLDKDALRIRRSAFG